MYSPVFLSNPTTSGSPPVLSISLSDHIFSVLASSLVCTLAHSRPLWRSMFFSKRAFNALSSSSRCSGDNSFLLLLMFFILRSLRILELRIEFSSALSREIEDIPDRYQLVDAAFFDVTPQPWMTGIRVMNRTVIVASEDGYRRILVSFFVFASEVVFECARAGAQKTQSAPPSRASMASQSR